MFQFVDKANFIAVFMLIVVEGAKTPAGGRDREDPAGRSPRRLPDRPQESDAPETKINK
jgi:hypothetical protein